MPIDSGTEQANEKIRVTFLARSLDFGGTQRQLVTLAKAIDKSRFEISIVTFYGGHAFEHELVGTDVQVISLDKAGRWDLFMFLRRLVRTVKETRPHIIHGYLDVPNVLALYLRRFVPAQVVWGVRAGPMALDQYDWLFRLAARLEQSLAKSPDLIIVNSYTAFAEQLRKGFPEDKLKLIPNGIDSDFFKPDQSAREQLRKSWSVDESIALIGTVGRLDPVKDLPTFLNAAAIVSREVPSARFVCVGEGPPDYTRQLTALAQSLGIADKLIWAGPLSEMVAVYNALDLFVSASLAESSPNVVAEAMLCEVRCVATDAGDSKLVVGELAKVVPPKHPELLAETIIASLSTGQERSPESRSRIIENFSVEKLARDTENVLTDLVFRR
ncbi:MAG TPA: glycosyltransferase [Pyrinomonadaceae bacterium]|jgi:glycosyltransferase involved in cell wall biosynthesis|nr:glycosyltransferase [Pyrinomonadaceae bacterium]